MSEKTPHFTTLSCNFCHRFTEETTEKVFDWILKEINSKEKIVTQSTTDPESGVFHKGEHKKCFAYTAQTACDKNGYVVDVTETFTTA